MFSSLAEMVDAAEQQGKPLYDIVITAELKQSRRTREEIWERMRQRLLVMRRSAEMGIAQPVRSLSGISGGSAYKFWQWLEAGNQPLCGPILSRAVAHAMAVNEVNAGMGCIVATPTAGSAGILPGVLLTLQAVRGFSDDDLVAALFTASGIGAVIIHRAHVSRGTPHQSAHAVAITLKNMLGLVCDPVAGLVEVPCVKRNAAGAAQCFVAVDLALAGVESVIPPDEVIDAMRYRETAQGGLAATPTGKRLAKLVWSEKR